MPRILFIELKAIISQPNKHTLLFVVFVVLSVVIIQVLKISSTGFQHCSKTMGALVLGEDSLGFSEMVVPLL